MRLFREPDRKRREAAAAIARELLAEARRARARSDALPALATKSLRVH
jgi:hypothetical protein